MATSAQGLLEVEIAYYDLHSAPALSLGLLQYQR